jgi:hypothetical protein
MKLSEADLYLLRDVKKAEQLMPDGTRAAKMPAQDRDSVVRLLERNRIVPTMLSADCAADEYKDVQDVTRTYSSYSSLISRGLLEHVRWVFPDLRHPVNYARITPAGIKALEG